MPLHRPEGMAGVPVSVTLDGAAEFVLEVADGGDNISCDQSDWADAKVVLDDRRVNECSSSVGSAAAADVDTDPAIRMPSQQIRKCPDIPDSQVARLSLALTVSSSSVNGLLPVCHRCRCPRPAPIRRVSRRLCHFAARLCSAKSQPEAQKQGV